MSAPDYTKTVSTTPKENDFPVVIQRGKSTYYRFKSIADLANHLRKGTFVFLPYFDDEEKDGKKSVKCTLMGRTNGGAEGRVEFVTASRTWEKVETRQYGDKPSAPKGQYKGFANPMDGAKYHEELNNKTKVRVASRIC